MVQVSGLVFLLPIGISFMVSFFIVGVIAVQVRNQLLRAMFQEAFVTPTIKEIIGSKIIDLEKLSEKKINYLYDAKRIGEKVLRRRY